MSKTTKEDTPSAGVYKEKVPELLPAPAKSVVDECMVKSKARCHLFQYMKNKPCKWGFKYWVIADTSGYTLHFDLYTGKMVQEKKQEKGLISL